MRIGFFGGTFDPPHRGHLAVAEAVADHFHLDRILLAPVGVQPLKPEGASATFEQRFAMVKLLAQTDPRLQASVADAPGLAGEPNFTIDTLTRLRSTLAPGDALFNIVGADAFADLPRWKNPAGLLEAAEWIVVSRPGLDIAAIIDQVTPPALRSRVHALDGVAETVSATELRERLLHHEPVTDLLPGSILRYIQTHGLYQTHIGSLR